MTRLMLASVVAVLICISPLQAALVFNFDSLPLGNIDGLNLGGLTITSVDGSTRTVSDSGVGYISPFNAVTNSGFVTVNPLVLTFDSIMTKVTLTGGDRGGDTDRFTMTAYDPLNAVLGSVTTPIFGGNPLHATLMVDNYTASLSFPNIKRVEVATAINAGIGIDDVIAEPIPEPTSILIWSLVGAVGVVYSWRRYRSRVRL